jgi:hypothetical protein
VSIALQSLYNSKIEQSVFGAPAEHFFPAKLKVSAGFLFLYLKFYNNPQPKNAVCEREDSFFADISLAKRRLSPPIEKVIPQTATA